MGSVVTLQRGFDLPHRLRKLGTVPIVTSSGVGATHSEFKVLAPGVVTGRYGTIGEVFFLQEDFWPLNTTLYVRDFHGNDPLFVSYLLRTIDFHTHSGKSGVPGVNRNDLHDIGVVVPVAAAQQCRIAEALSDADALIESLEQLLAKKRQIKQGAMQELLTGQRRLPGFVSDWHVMRLAELADIRSGGTPSTSRSEFWAGEIPWCTPTDITALQGGKYLQQTSRTVSALGLAASSAELIPPGSIVMTSRASIGVCAINVVPLSTNQGFKNFVPFECVVGEFLYYLLTVQRQRFLNLCAGSTFLEIGKAQLVGYEVCLPIDKSEQTAIATTLSDMDAELTALEARVAKTRLLKQGMAQALLTGRIRLV